MQIDIKAIKKKNRQSFNVRCGDSQGMQKMTWKREESSSQKTTLLALDKF